MERNLAMDKLMHAIHMSDKFSFDGARVAVAVAFAKNSDEYRAVAGFYQNTRAQRSQVPGLDSSARQEARARQQTHG